MNTKSGKNIKQLVSASLSYNIGGKELLKLPFTCFKIMNCASRHTQKETHRISRCSRKQII